MTKGVAELHWDYLLLLEKDLIAIAETIELDEANFRTYGPRILQLILAAGSELDVSLKDLARVIAPDSLAEEKNQRNMGHYKIFLCDCMQEQITTARVKILRSELSFAPWEVLSEGPNVALPWWSSYNNVKHNRSECYKEATLETALNLLAALFVVDAYLLEATMTCWHGFTQVLDWDSHKHLPQLDDELRRQQQELTPLRRFGHAGAL